MAAASQLADRWMQLSGRVDEYEDAASRIVAPETDEWWDRRLLDVARSVEA